MSNKSNDYANKQRLLEDALDKQNPEENNLNYDPWLIIKKYNN